VTNLHKKVLALFIIAVSDSILTVYLVVKGWGEANPLMNWYMHMTDVTCMAITKIIGTFIILFLLYKRKETEKHLNWAIPAYLTILFGGVSIQLLIL
jgi:hypothetical protein